MAHFNSEEIITVTNDSGTDISFRANPFTTCSHEITVDGGIAFLPPSETTSDVITDTANGKIVVDIYGNDMAAEFKEKLFSLPVECRKMVELGQGLSKMEPTGLIGVDESIIDSCHFGFGDGQKCGTHLDVVIKNPTIKQV